MATRLNMRNETFGQLVRFAIVGLLSSAVRIPSVIVARPPASSIFIAIDVPDRGRPETTTMGGP